MVSKKKRKKKVKKSRQLDVGSFVSEASEELSSKPADNKRRAAVVVSKKKPQRKAAPLTVVKKQPTEEELANWLSTVPGFIEGLTETEFNPTRLYGYQVKYLNRKVSFWHIDKARQTGFSYVFAAEGLAKSHLMHKYTKIFISINQDEANEKITYARAMYDSMPLAWKKKLVVDNRKCLEFEGKWRGRTTRTRIISHAQREPRGKGGNTEVVLDEAAHYIFGNQIYTAALPITTRGKGGITIGSTPLGKSGIHWDIADKPEFRRIYRYQRVFWWHCIDFVQKGKFKEANKKANKMSTAERVDKYGSDKLISIFLSMDLESFQQEYELLHIDESVSFFPLDLIKRCTYSVIKDKIYLEEDEYAEDAKSFPVETSYPEVKFNYYTALDDLAAAKRAGEFKGSLSAGFDVGRRKHNAELIIVEDVPRGPVALRGRIKFNNVDFEAQEAELGRAIDWLGLERMGIDETGPGIQLGENMEKKYPGVCIPINFTNSWKELNASHTRRLMETQNLALPDDRDVRGQFHSIKRMVTDHGNLRFDAEKNKEHHGDIVWATALAVEELRPDEIGSLSVSKKKVDRAVPENIVSRPKKRLFNKKTTSVPIARHTGPSFGVLPPH